MVKDRTVVSISGPEPLNPNCESPTDTEYTAAVVLSWDDSAHRGHSTMSEDIFDCHSGVEGAIGIQGIEARDTMEHPSIHLTAPHSQK